MADDLEGSFKTLKQTIPLLLKHEMPAVPTNYALWYTYVSNQSEELNQQLDQIVDTKASLTPLKAKELYRKHLADQGEVDAWQLRQAVEAMLVELSQSLTDTREDTHKFKQTMDSSLSDLEKVEKEGWSMEEVMGLVRNMLKESQQIRRSTLDFTAALANAEDEISKLRKELKQTQEQAMFDALTGLHNRGCFDQALAALKPESKACLIMMDVDHFKKVNDDYGHQMGDMVLKGVAKKLKAMCKENAQAFRYGGEEFAILVTNTDLKRTLHQADILRRTIEKVTVIDRRNGQKLDGISASFGVAAFNPEDRRNDMLERADQQLYEAKRLGRNRVMPIR